MKQAKNPVDMLFKLGHGKIQYSQDVKDALTVLIVAWDSFCAQDREHKELIPFSKTGGYENKDRRIDPTSRDHKEDFHITLGYQFPENLILSEQDMNLLSAGKTLLRRMRSSLQEMAEVLTEATERDFVKLAMEDDSYWVLRLLHYYPGNTDRIPAHHHSDKGGHTAHLHDSTPGFECFWNNEWQELRFNEDEMVFFPGLLAQYESECKLPALCHRVVTTPEIVDGGRVSFVLFNDYKNSEMTYDKKTWGPAQNAFQPGENYDMPIEEFKKYFKVRSELDAT